MEAGPFGRNPPSLTRLPTPLAAWLGRPKTTSSAPTTMNTITAETLIEDSRNSRAPKDFTLTTFRPRISRPKKVTEAHRGICGNQNSR